MAAMAETRADLLYDPNDIGPDCVVRSRISNGPRGQDPTFDPQIGDRVVLIDHDGEILCGRVTDRCGDGVWVQAELTEPLSRSA